MNRPISLASSVRARAAIGRPIFPGILAALVLAPCARPATADEKQSPQAAVRILRGDDARQVESLKKTINQLKSAGQFAEAVEPARKVLATCQKALGPDHWQTADARRAVDDLRQIAALAEEGRQAMASVGDLYQKADAEQQRAHYAEAERISRASLAIHRRWLGEDHPDTAQSDNSVAFYLIVQGKYAAAEPFSRQALAIRLKALGENHPDTVTSVNDLAYGLDHQGKPTEAEPLFRRALASRLKVLGADHPDTASAYNNLAYCLGHQGKPTEAEPLYRKALAIWQKALGEEHPSTALAYNNVAYSLNEQGKYAEAEALFRRALASRLKALGEEHPDTANAYNNVGYNLNEQGKYAEAEPVLRRALASRLKVLGEDHPDTAQTANNLAYSLDHQGKPTEAEPLFRKALAIRLKALGADHPDTAESSNNLAFSLNKQGKYAEAESLYRQALAIWQKLGADHPDTAFSYSNLAANMDAQGKSAEAERLHRQALTIRLKALGADHPYTAFSYSKLAADLDAQDKFADAVANWTAAAAIYERTRGARSASGVERSLTPLGSPLPALAMALARQNTPRPAWARWESDLARGLLDDLSARLLRPLTRDERQREDDLIGQLQGNDERIARLAAQSRRTQGEDNQLDALRNDQSVLRGQWVEFQNTLDRRYLACAGKPSTLDEVQKALPGNAALVGWLDVGKHHWACIVRHEGDPTWVKITGSGPAGAWTQEDDARPATVRAALAGHQPGWGEVADGSSRAAGATGRRRRPSARLGRDGGGPGPPAARAAQVPPEGCDAPDRPALAGFGRRADRDAGRGLAGRRAAAGGQLCPLGLDVRPAQRAPHSRPPGPPRLLALCDPAFPRPAPGGPALTPPDHGIPILAVVPQGVADLFEIKPGDVLLEYNGRVLTTVKDLAIVPAGDKPVRVPVKLWRDGEIRSREIAAGELGIQSNPDRPAAQVVLAQRAAALVLRSGVRAAGLASLPGTRREVQAIAALFPKDQVAILLGPDATESNLQRLAQAGALKTYRYIHLATHGQANPQVALSSAIFLAAEPERPATPVADPAAPESAPDGQVTALQIVRTWELNADLVVLSACESGLGRYAGGEGYLGFAQALFVKGAKSLVLSQWKVDDKATALLMARFYQNLLGRRPGLARPLPKAAALDEAKRWLRELAADEVGSELAALDRGSVRPLVAKADGPAPHAASSAPRPAGVRPYAHPYYWAAFILIGDPR